MLRHLKIFFIVSALAVLAGGCATIPDQLRLIHTDHDGQSSQSLRQCNADTPTAGGFIALPLERGEHRIVLTPYLSLLRRGLLALDLVLLGGAVLVILAERRRERA